MLEKVLVTGGCGFIGANLVPKLLARGVAVRVLDNFTRTAVAGFDDGRIEIVEGDIRDREAVASAVSGVDAVVHLAAFGSVVESIAEPMENFEINAGGTLNLLNACRGQQVSRFVFASTGGALIGNAMPPVSEQSLPRPISPYGASKLCGEAYCHGFAGAYGLSTVALRFANVYGPFSAHKQGAITAFSKAILSGERIVIFGDGSASRDFLHVDDLCRGIMLALEKDLPGGTVLHLASGIETTVNELAAKLVRIAGFEDHPIEYRSARRGEVTKNFASFDKAKEILGFTPTIDLDTGLAMTWQWFASRRDNVLSVGTSDS